MSGEVSAEARVRPIPVKCPLGGYAPCDDDLCHGVDTTMCGLEMDFDVCYHGFYPDTCGECSDEYDWDDDAQAVLGPEAPR